VTVAVVADFKPREIKKYVYEIKLILHCGSGGRTTFSGRGRREERESAPMKTLLAGAALAAAVASSALAQTVPQYYSPYAQAIGNGRHEYIYPPDNHAHSSNPANDVYDTRGRYVGSDPDPFIRDTMARSHSKD